MVIKDIKSNLSIQMPSKMYQNLPKLEVWFENNLATLDLARTKTCDPGLVVQNT
jgi:hypothetical protein